MSFGGGGSSAGAGTGTQTVQPYTAAQPALNQIISEAGQIYGSGVGEYVAPTQQTLTGLAGQETLGTAGKYPIQLDDALSIFKLKDSSFNKLQFRLYNWILTADSNSLC